MTAQHVDMLKSGSILKGSCNRLVAHRHSRRPKAINWVARVRSHSKLLSQTCAPSSQLGKVTVSPKLM